MHGPPCAGRYPRRIVSASGYFLKTKSGPKGPFTLSQLRSMWHAGKLTGSAKFNTDGGERWQLLEGLRDQLDAHPAAAAHPAPPNRPAASAPPPPAPAGPSSMQVHHHNPASDRQLLYESRKKSGWVAALLNVILPGAGYMYCGNIVLGFVAFFFSLLFLVITVGLGALLLWPMLIIDGFLCAGRANRRLADSLLR